MSPEYSETDFPNIRKIRIFGKNGSESRISPEIDYPNLAVLALRREGSETSQVLRRHGINPFDPHSILDEHTSYLAQWLIRADTVIF